MAGGKCGGGMHGMGGMHGRGCVWQEAWMAGRGGGCGKKKVIAAGGTYPTGMHSSFIPVFSTRWDF